MKATARKLFEEAAQVKAAILNDEKLVSCVATVAALLRDTASKGGTIYSCGNGGSACDAMHLTEELVARFKRERPGIRAMHFLDSATLSCWSNDYDYQSAFERQARTFCRSGDILCAFSTSGNSKNVVRAIKAANEAGATTIGFTGEGGGELAACAKHIFKVPSKVTERIQEGHITIIHVLLELIEGA